VQGLGFAYGSGFTSKLKFDTEWNDNNQLGMPRVFPITLSTILAGDFPFRSG